MPAPSPLCPLSDIPDPGSVGFTLGSGAQRVRIMVIRHGGGVYGYVNSCPHILAPLDWERGQFLDSDRQYILCGNHFALFDIATGRCLRGPCKGRSLTPYPVAVVDGWVVPCPPPNDL